ncbi:Homeodomain superfamily protein isoform 2 [Hibiscus syriacus]|uniref:Homeodomain superfamily protein isoform 2 n=1 Tax=Hibiscus syriacus TaxID=106335 RepID=A0A6A2YZK6_HIBSY|nr:Homeodomain superfamily protein isoform 2 [Hibiscus syriacus]
MEDSDLFSEEPLVTQARAGVKFQPKFKRKAKVETSCSIPSKPREITEEEAATVASTAIDAVQVVNPDNIVDDSKSSQVAATDSLLAEAAVCDDTNSSLERSVGENADLFSGLECVDPLCTQSSNDDGDIRNDNEGNRTQFQEAGAFPDIDTLDTISDMKITSGRHAGKFKPKPRLQTSVLTSPPAVVESVMHPPNAQFGPSETLFGERSIPDLPTDHVPNCSSPDPSTSGSECPVNEEFPNLAVASNLGVDLWGNVPVVAREVSSNIMERNTSLVSSPQKSRQSSTRDEVNGKSKARKWLREQVTNLNIVDDLEDGTCNDDGFAAEHPLSYAINEDKDDNNGECSVERVSTKRKPSKRSKKPVNESEKPPRKRKIANEAQGTNLHIVDDLEDGTCNDDSLAAEHPLSYAINEDKDDNDGDENDNGEYNVECVSAKRKPSKSSKKPVNESEKPPRKCKIASEAQVTNLHIVDDLEDGTGNDNGLAAEHPFSYAVNEDKDDNNGDENDNGEYNVEHVSAKRKPSKRSKKPMNESEKPPQKCKIANEAQKHKKSLLNTPEDEIDFARVALKDLILLADYKERLAKKEANALGVPLTDQITQKTFDEVNAHDEESPIASEQDQGFADDQVGASAKSTTYFNYQTHMNKTPRVRWSKQDTELFYGAIRQFGPDFSLIEQLFPGRNRHQIKLKFKNEERRSPFKLSDALASRAKDHSYFEKVIEQLRQVSGADLESNRDISIDLTREEEEFTPAGTNEEVAKPEQDEDVAKPEQDEDVVMRDREADVTDDHSTLQSDEMDDDREILSSYKSAF